MHNQTECPKCSTTDNRLLWMLRVLGDEFGPSGVATVAEHLYYSGVGTQNPRSPDASAVTGWSVNDEGHYRKDTP